MESSENKIIHLVIKSYLQPLSEEESSILADYSNASIENRQKIEELLDKQHLTENLQIYGDGLRNKESSLKSLQQRLKNENSFKNKRPDVVKLVSYAAAVLILVITGGIVTWYLSHSPGISTKMTDKAKKNSTTTTRHLHKATLTLADGKQIELADLNNETSIKEQGLVVKKTADGVVELISGVNDQGIAQAQNTSVYSVSTPVGGNYQVILPDGSKVWLNALSEIKIPAGSEDERLAMLTGEGYFQVAQDSKRPFKVKAGRMVIDVIGTSFNINAYPDENFIKATLLNGSVKISKSSLSSFLKPGQEISLLKNGKFTHVTSVDTSDVLAWKCGSIKFKAANIEIIMRQISREYGVEVEYGKNVSKKELSGEIPKGTSLVSALRGLEDTEMQFRLEHNKIIVTAR